MKKVKLRSLTDSQFASAPRDVKAAHLKARIGMFDIYSKEADVLMKQYPDYFIKEKGRQLFPNNPVSVIWKAIVHVYNVVTGKIVPVDTFYTDNRKNRKTNIQTPKKARK